MPHHFLEKGCATNKKYTICRVAQQYNLVSNIVLSTIMWDIYADSQQRGRIIEKWLRIAHHLREMKNFCSLQAIISTLQISWVERLSTSWKCVSKESMILYEYLLKITSFENNYQEMRNIIIGEATAKIGINKNDKPALALPQVNYGTVPYIGIFLKDLEMIDSAFKNKINENINFDKCRKKFHILIEIKLLQKATNNYNIEVNNTFTEKLKRLNILNSSQCYQNSFIIQPRKGTTTTKCQSMFTESISGPCRYPTNQIYLVMLYIDKKLECFLNENYRKTKILEEKIIKDVPIDIFLAEIGEKIIFSMRKKHKLSLMLKNTAKNQSLKVEILHMTIGFLLDGLDPDTTIHLSLEPEKSKGKNRRLTISTTL